MRFGERSEWHTHINQKGRNQAKKRPDSFESVSISYLGLDQDDGAADNAANYRLNKLIKGANYIIHVHAQMPSVLLAVY